MFIYSFMGTGSDGSGMVLGRPCLTGESIDGAFALEQDGDLFYLSSMIKS